MNTFLKLRLSVVAFLGATSLAHAQTTAFTYHGRLNNGGAPVNGAHDMRFSVYDADTGGLLVAGPLPVNSVNVANGLFTARIDFGAGIFTGPPRWLEVSVRQGGAGAFITLSPRQELTSSPYAIRAQSAGTAADVANGSVVKSLNGLRDTVSLAAGANVTLTPSGNTITIASSGGNGPWLPSGSSIFYNGGNVGIGNNDPSARLFVTSTTANATDNTATFWATGIGPNASHIHYGVNGDWYIRSASANGKVILEDTGGNVGIGTASPATKLTVGTSFGNYGMEHTDGNVRLSTYIDGAGGWLGTVSNHKLNFYVNNSFPKMTVDTTGNVGIGTTGPTTKLTVQNSLYGIEHTDGAVRVGTFLSSLAGWFGTLSNHRLQFFVNDGGASMTIDTAGNVGIGTTGPSAKLDVSGDVKTTRLILRADPLAPANAAVLCEDANVANFVPFNTALGRPMNVIAAQLTITGGADVAEPFAMSHEGISAGSVVVIDENSPGSLRLGTEAYDKRVAGIVSGANGIRPGISLHQEGAIEGNENVALSGRVYVQADAAFGAIKPGDLLTTSNTPGHAMRVTDHAQAQGAILGKAMGSLKQGKGMVLVLVTLQ